MTSQSPHLRPPRAPGGGADCKRTAPGTESMADLEVKDFYKFTVDDLHVEDYITGPQIKTSR